MWSLEILHEFMMKEIFLYQIQYDDKSKPSDESGFLTFDCRHNPEFLKREVAHLLRFYDEVVQYASDDSYFALFSPKFNNKTGLSSEDVKQFIDANPQQDIYLFNPYPMMTYRYFNVWEQLENSHSGLAGLAKNLFQQAKIDFDISVNHRNHNHQVVYCNYWVASKSFYDAFIPFVRLLDHTIDKMNDDEKAKYFEETNYITTACVYPFIFERVIVLYLFMNPQIQSLPYTFIGPFKGSYKLKNIEQNFYSSNLRKTFDLWEKQEHLSVEELEEKFKIIHTILYPKSRFKFVSSIEKRINMYKMDKFSDKIFTNHSVP